MSPSSFSFLPNRRRWLQSTLGVACLALALPSMLPAETVAPVVAGTLVVTNKGDRTLSIIDPQTNKQVAVVPEDGITGHEVSTSSDGKYAFVPIFGNSGVGKPGTDGQLIRVIDIAKREIIATIDYGKGVRPHCPVTCVKTGLLYVTTELENSVSIIDPKTFKILGSVPTGHPESHMLAVSKDGKRGYTANVASGTVSVMDLEEKKLITSIQAATRTQRISLSVDDKLAFTADQVQPLLVVIDTATNKVKNTVALPDYGYGTAPTPDGKTLLVAIINRGLVAEVDLSTMKITRTVEVPAAPQAILISPDGAKAYVSCDASAQVAAIDLKAWKVESLINVGKVADGLAWAKAQ
ncbi:MAG: cytochrome D1 domain-containing protein [Verrucomicrobium sp.]|nr:cytochrome D1 domain-containing protein [Verrucomicrobium sp.]